MLTAELTLLATVPPVRPGVIKYVSLTGIVELQFRYLVVRQVMVVRPGVK